MPLCTELNAHIPAAQLRFRVQHEKKRMLKDLLATFQQHTVLSRASCKILAYGLIQMS